MTHSRTNVHQDKLQAVLADWQARAQALRQKQAFCREHRFTLEQRCLHEQVELLDALLIDLQIALLPVGGEPADPMTPDTLPDVERAFLAALLTQAAALIGQRVSADLEPVTVRMLPDADRARLMSHYNLWNSGEAEPADYFMGHLDAWLQFYAARFQAGVWTAV